MTTLHFRGPHRTAAKHLLAYTPLGEALDRIGSVTDEDDLLTVNAPDPSSLSSGEWALLDFLASLGGYGPVYLHSTLAHLDDDCQRALWWSIGLAAGHLADVAPVRFEGVA